VDLTQGMKEMKMEMADESGPFPYRLLPEKKGRTTPKQKVKVSRWYLKRKDAGAWKKKRRMSKVAKKARRRNRGK